MSDAEERIFGLLALAQEQQAAVKAGLEGLAIEREALAKERGRLTAQLSVMTGLSRDLTVVIQQVGPQMSAAAAKAATVALEKALHGTAERATTAVTLAARPVVERFEEAISSTGVVSEKLRRAVADFTKRWTILAVAISASAILATGLICYFVVGWERDELDALSKERDKLKAEVGALPHQADAARRGGRKPKP